MWNISRWFGSRHRIRAPRGALIRAGVARGLVLGGDQDRGVGTESPSAAHTLGLAGRWLQILQGRLAARSLLVSGGLLGHGLHLVRVMVRLLRTVRVANNLGGSAASSGCQQSTLKAQRQGETDSWSC